MSTSKLIAQLYDSLGITSLPNVTEQEQALLAIASLRQLARGCWHTATEALGKPAEGVPEGTQEAFAVVAVTELARSHRELVKALEWSLDAVERHDRRLAEKVGADLVYCSTHVKAMSKARAALANAKQGAKEGQ